MEDLDIAFKEARSFPGLIPPNNAVLIGKKEVPNDIVNVYKDSKGKYWYDTETNRKFELEMQEKSKRRQQEKRRLRIRGKLNSK